MDTWYVFHGPVVCLSCPTVATCISKRKSVSPCKKTVEYVPKLHTVSVNSKANRLHEIRYHATSGLDSQCEPNARLGRFVAGDTYKSSGTHGSPIRAEYTDEWKPTPPLYQPATGDLAQRDDGQIFVFVGTKWTIGVHGMRHPNEGIERRLHAERLAWVSRQTLSRSGECDNDWRSSLVPY